MASTFRQIEELRDQVEAGHSWLRFHAYLYDDRRASLSARWCAEYLDTRTDHVVRLYNPWGLAEYERLVTEGRTGHVGE